MSGIRSVVWRRFPFRVNVIVLLEKSTSLNATAVSANRHPWAMAIAQEIFIHSGSSAASTIDRCSSLISGFCWVAAALSFIRLAGLILR